MGTKPHPRNRKTRKASTQRAGPTHQHPLPTAVSPLYTAFGNSAAGHNLLKMNEVEAANLIKDTPAVGNCFFEAASWGIHGHWDLEGALRQRVADEIENHPERYRMFAALDPDQLRKINLPANHQTTLADIVTYTRTPGCWAFDIHGEALRRCHPEVIFTIWIPLPKPLHPWELNPSGPSASMLTNIRTSINVWMKHPETGKHFPFNQGHGPHRHVHIRFTQYNAAPCSLRRAAISMQQCNHYEAFTEPPNSTMLFSFDDFRRETYTLPHPPNPSQRPTSTARRHRRAQRNDLSPSKFPD